MHLPRPLKVHKVLRLKLRLREQSDFQIVSISDMFSLDVRLEG